MKEKLKKPFGILLIIVGIISILTPFTPLGFLLLVGLELIGAREAVTDKVKSWMGKAQR